MKRLLYLLLSLLMFGCKDILTEAPKSIAVETFYNTPAEVEAAVNAIYSPLRLVGSLGGEYIPQVDSYIDYAYGRGSYAILSEFQGLDPTNIARTQNFWNNFYLSIRNANLVIQNAPNGLNLSEEQIDRYVAEARFMRALNYFFLVRHWGGVILRTEKNMDERAVPRSSTQQVYELIEEDLEFAEANLPLAAPLPGKPSLWAAKTLLADVYFFQGRNSEAAAKAEEVIDQGPYSLVSVTLAEGFGNIFGPEVMTTSEEIFYLKFSRNGTQQGWNTVMFFHHPGSGLFGSGGYFSHYTDTETNPVYKNWDDQDLRKAYNWYSYNIGLGDNSLLNKKYIDPLATNGRGAGNDYPLYRYGDLLLLYAEAAALSNGNPTVATMEALNMVHRRAYGRTPTDPSDVDFQLSDYDLEDFVDLVIKERGYETQMEGKRWLDLVRSDKVREIIRAATGKEIADKHFLWPIPVSEMNFNDALDPGTDQNIGY